MHPSTEARLQRLHRAAAHDDDDDDLEWSTLRTRAEQAWRHEHAAVHAAVAGDARALPPPLPRRHPSLRSLDVAEPPTMLFDALESDLLEWVPRRRHPWPVLLSVLICTAAVGTAFVRHRVAEAEQQARIEKAVMDIRASHDSLAVGSAGVEPRTLAVVPPQAAAPKSETLAAFLRMSETPPDSLRANLPMRRLPVRAVRVHRHAPPRPAATAVPSPSADVPRFHSAEPDQDANPSDDPLFGL